MRIVHLNKNDLSGGAARAAYRLHRGLRCIGHDSSMVVESKTSDDGTVKVFEKPMDGWSVIRRGLRQLMIARNAKKYQKSRPQGYELFSDARSSFAATLFDQIPACQIINLHWIPNFVDYQAFFSQAPHSAPIVWTLHDLNPLTGGCHYGLGCERYLTGCGACPQLGSQDAQDLSHRVWANKNRLFSKVAPSRLLFVAPSRWLANEVERTPIFRRFPVTVIPYGLDLGEFLPRNREHVRDLLGIPHGARVLLFVAEEISNRRKGFALLLEALEQCAGKIPHLLLLSVGQSRPQLQIGTPWLHVGSVNNDRFLSMVYSAADVFVICSLQDNLPNTVLEAMACGVPVVGQAVGGIPEMVRHGETGFTVPVNDVGALADAICNVLKDNDQRAAMSKAARHIAVKEYSLELQARRYAAVYANLVGE